MIIGNVISTVIGYFLWTHKYDNSNKAPIYKYYLMYCSILIYNIILMLYQVEYLGLSTNIAPVFASIITAIYNYFISKKVLFNSKFNFSFRTIKEEIDNNRLFYVILFITLFFVFAMLINNLFNYPSLNDFIDFNDMNFKDGINGILSFVVASIKRFGNMYVNSQGTYFNNLLSCFNPLFISINMYKFVSFIIQLFWIYSIYFFFKSFINKKNIRDILLISIIFLLFSIVFMYSISNGLYNLYSVRSYLIPFSISLILLGFLIRYIRFNKKCWYYSSIATSILLGGTNYITGIFVMFIVLSITIYLYIKKDDRYKKFIILSIIYVISFLINILSPGNSGIINKNDDLSITQFIHIIIVNAYEMINYLLFKTLYIPFMIILMPTIKKLIRDSKYKFEKPVILIILSSVCFILFFVPGAYINKSNYQAPGELNIQLFYLVLMTTLCFINYYGYLYQHKEFKDEITSPNLILIGFISSTIMISSIGTINISGFKMIDDLVYLKSKKYEMCMMEINSSIKHSKEKEITIRNCIEYSTSIYHYKLKNNQKILKTLEKYYNKKITIEE